MSDVIIPVSKPIGSLPLRNARHEVYARHRALNMSARTSAIKAGLKPENGAVYKLERNRNVQARIAWFAQQEVELVRRKRARLEEFQWAVHEANYADYWETIDEPMLDDDGEPTGETRKVQRLKRFDELSVEQQEVVESLKYTEKGRPMLSLYSKMQANIELRKMNAIGPTEREEGADNYGRLTDAELVQTVAQQARELGRYDQLFASIGGVNGD